MRKIIAILVGLVMLFSIPALGEETDFSNMSVDELIALKDQLQNEIESRISLGDSNTIGTGKYEAGTTIKAGTYEFTATECTIEKVDGVCRCDITIYMLDQEVNKYREWSTEYVAVGETIMIALSDGMWFEIDGGAGLLREVNPTWAP